MANNLAAIQDKILARALITLRELAVMPRLVNSDFSTEGAMQGTTIDIPVPTAMNVIDVAPGVTAPNNTDRTPGLVQVPLSNWKQNEPFGLTDKELVEVSANRHFVPMQVQEAVRALANTINEDILDEYKGVYGFVGTPGTTPFGSSVGVQSATNVRKVLNQQLCPKNSRRLVLDFDAEAAALALAEFSDVDKADDRPVKMEGEIGRKYGFDIFADDAVPYHTAGTITTGLAGKASTAQAVGLTTIVATTAVSTGACALVVGDIIEIAGDDQTYVLTAAATQASAAADVSLQIAPALKVALTGGEAITRKASHRVNLAFHRDAFAFAMRPLADALAGFPGNENIRVLQDPITGVVLRLEVKRQHKQVAWEFDVLWGAKLIRPELAVRLAG